MPTSFVVSCHVPVLNGERRGPILTMLRNGFSAIGLKTLAIDRIAVFRQENADSRFLIVKHWPLCSNA